MRAARGLAWFVGSVVALACGGATDVSDDDSGFGGSGPGVAGSGAGGHGNTAGAPVGHGGRPIFAGAPGVGGCGAAPLCKAGDLGFPTKEECAAPDCYRVVACGTSLWCTPRTQCTAVPTCNVGDVQLMGECPPGARPACYERTTCGATIWCLQPSGIAGAPGAGGTSGAGGVPVEGGAGGASGAPSTCDSTAGVEHDRRYVSRSPRECQLIDYACPPNTTTFTNDCGCGCEQSPSCPEFVDCMPGGPMNVLCNDATLCPYTLRAL